MGRRTTIGDVASAAGVSVATVSRVLNGGAVKEDTAARVQAAVARLGYTPNALTKSIFSGRSTTIGVVIQDLSSPFYLDLMRGIDEVASANDSLVMFANTYSQPGREVEHVRTMDEQRVRGLIVTTGEDTDSRAHSMTANGTPCVVVARPVDGLHSVSLDNVAAGRMMAAHLAACGRSSVGVVCTSSRRPSQIGRTAGLRAGLADAGLPAPSVVEVGAQADMTAAVATLLRDRPDALDAVVCLTGRLTVGTYTALTAAGLSVPGDVAFLTMDEFPWAAALGITVVAQPSYEMGRQAAGLVVEAPEEPVHREFAPTLVPRTSCGES